MTRFITGALALLLLPVAARAQNLESRVYARPDATVRLSYASRPGVCGSQHGGINIRDGNEEEDGWTSDCEEGPVRVVITLKQGAVSRLTTRVGGLWLPMGRVTDLGTVSAPEASQLMLAIARKGGKAADDAILPAMLADSVTIWPDLIRLAKNPSVNTDVRKSAIFWVGQAAAKAATAGLVEVVGDAAVNQDVREAAVFALSQRPHDEGVPALITTARTANDAKIRKSAIFWLGQTDDPRALAYFEEVLAKGASRN
jgi:hypothetical protein